MSISKAEIHKATKWTTEPLSKRSMNIQQVEAERQRKQQEDLIAALRKAQEATKVELARTNRRINDKQVARQKNKTVAGKTAKQLRQERNKKVERQATRDHRTTPKAIALASGFDGDYSYKD